MLFAPAVIGKGVVAATSALIGPGTRSQISAITSSIGRPALAIRVGLVVTPSTRPESTRRRISRESTFATVGVAFLPARAMLRGVGVGRLSLGSVTRLGLPSVAGLFLSRTP